MTYQELIDRSTVQAGLQGPSPHLELMANSLLGQVFQDAAKRLTGTALPKLTKTVTFTNGAATITDDVLIGSLTDSVLYDPADPTKIYAFVPEWDDFIRVYDTRIGHFTDRGGTNIYVIEPGDDYDDGVGLTGDLKLVVAGVPAVPATAAATIVAPQEFVNLALDLLAERLKGAVVAAP